MVIAGRWPVHFVRGRVDSHPQLRCRRWLNFCLRGEVSLERIKFYRIEVGSVRFDCANARNA